MKEYCESNMKVVVVSRVKLNVCEGSMEAVC